MKLTFDIPVELYRRVEAKLALEKRSVHEVAVERMRQYADGPLPCEAGTDARELGSLEIVDSVPVPGWFGAFREAARRVDRHGLDEVRRSIARGIVESRDP